MVFKNMTGKKARKKGDMPFAQKCTRAGIRMTSQRHLLATVLEEAADHPDVETIYLRCKEKDSSISIASIYRSLGIFEDYQLIQKLDVGDGKAYRESDHFRPGAEIVDIQTSIGHIGLSVCYDVRFARLYRQLAKKGAEILTIPAAFTRTSGQAHWYVLQRARAIETGCFVLASAQIGTHDDGRQTYGHSLIINPWGEVLADAGTMEEGFVIAEIDITEVAAARQKIRNLQHEPDYR